MAHFYAVTSQKATAVTCATKCSFIDPDEVNLVVAKGNRLEVYSLISSEGTSKSLLMNLEIQLFGRVVSIHAYTPQSSKVDSNTQVIFVLTEHHYFCVLGYDPIAKKAVKRASGDLKSTIGQRATIPKSAIDPATRMIAMHLYDGHIKILPMPATGGFSDAFDVRLLNVTRLMDMGFLHGAQRPTLVILHEDDVGGKHIKTFSIDIRERELSAGPWSYSNTDLTTHSIIPVSTGGVIMISQNIITYYGGSDKVVQSVTLDQSIIVASSSIDDAPGAATGEGAIRYLLGDDSGTLHALSLCRDSNLSIFTGTNIPAPTSSSGKKASSTSLPITGVTLDYVGSVHQPSSLVYLIDGAVFVGSYYGDSQLVQLLDNPNMANGTVPSYVSVAEEYANIGPILDMSVVASEKQGQDVVVTCSGAYGMGSLRVIRSGIGVDVQAQVELPGIKGIWSLTSETNSAYDKYIVQSFLGETRVLGMRGDEMEECELSGLDATVETIFCGNIGSSMVVQVTSSKAILLNSTSFIMTDLVSDPAGTAATITLASVHGNHFVLSCSGGTVIYLYADEQTQKLQRRHSTTLGNDIACTCLWPISSEDDMEVEHSSVTNQLLLACGLWTDHTVRILSLPSLQEVLSIDLGTKIQAREVLIVEMNSREMTSGNSGVSSMQLMVGLGDGTLVIYELQVPTVGAPAVSNRRAVTLGKKPIKLFRFHHRGGACVFATGDRPTVVHNQNGKLMFTIVNVPETTGIARFHSELFPNCLALTSPEGLLIGSIDDIQRLHVQTHKVDGDPRRIVHHASGGVYAVCTEKMQTSATEDKTLGQVLFLSEGSFDCIHSFELDTLEQAISCTSCLLHVHDRSSREKGSKGSTESKQEYVVIGTAYLTSQECDAGRLLVFSIVPAVDGTTPVVSLIAQIDCRGAVYSVCGLASGVLAVGVDYNVKIFRLDNSVGLSNAKDADSSSRLGSCVLTYECGFSSNILVLYLKAYGDFVLNGDLMRSMSLMHYGPKDRKEAKETEGVSITYELREVSRDMNTNYMRAVEFVGGDYDDHYMGADDSGNLFAVRRRLDATTEEERGRMVGQAEMHLSDHVNVLRQGTLCSQAMETTAISAGESSSASDQNSRTRRDTILYGSVSGSIGSIISINSKTFRFLLAVQKAVLACVPNMGGLPHDKWRSFKNERRTCAQRNFIDGDVVESILDGGYDRTLLQDITHYVNNELNKPASGASSTSNTNTSALALSTSTSEELYRYTVEEVLAKTEEMQRMH